MTGPTPAPATPQPPPPPPPPRGRRFRTLITVLLLAQVGLPLLAACAKDRLLFIPFAAPRASAGVPVIEPAGGRLVRVERPDGRALAAYDLAPPAIPGDSPVVLFLHGNAGNIALRAGIAASFAEKAQCRLLMPDYSGFGGNAGSPSEEEVYADALAAYDHLVADGVPAGRIVVYGESIGGGPALHVATERQVAGVVVQSSFSTLSSMALRTYWWMPLAALFVCGDFPNADRIARVTSPALVVHGRRDAIVPFAEGERLHAASGGRAEFLAIDGADHNDLFEIAGEDYLRDLGRRFRDWAR